MTCRGPTGNLLVVFVKYPEPGRVKTRLALGIGAEEAAAVYRELVAVTLAAVGAWLQTGGTVTADRRLRTVWMYFDPAEKRAALQTWLDPLVRHWPVAPQWVAQPDGSLGLRLQAVFQQGFSMGFDAVCAIGTDCPAVTAAGLEAAFATLACKDGVVGPTRDGGYYLIGIKSNHPSLFENIPWSSPDTLLMTHQAAERLGLFLVPLPVLEDVDTEADWQRWQGSRSGI